MFRKMSPLAHLKILLCLKSEGDKRMSDGVAFFVCQGIKMGSLWVQSTVFSFYGLFNSTVIVLYLYNVDCLGDLLIMS